MVIITVFLMMFLQSFTKIFSPVKEDIDILYIDWALLRSRRNPGQTAPALGQWAVSTGPTRGRRAFRPPT